MPPYNLLLSLCYSNSGYCGKGKKNLMETVLNMTFENTLILSRLMTTQEAFTACVDQDQAAQKMQSDL